MLAAAKIARTAAINAECETRILSRYPLPKQSSATLGVYPQAYRDSMAEWIAATVEASNVACDQVDAAADEAAVAAVTVSWPA